MAELDDVVRGLAEDLEIVLSAPIETIIGDARIKRVEQRGELGQYSLLYAAEPEYHQVDVTHFFESPQPRIFPPKESFSIHLRDGNYEVAYKTTRPHVSLELFKQAQERQPSFKDIGFFCRIRDTLARGISGEIRVHYSIRKNELPNISRFIVSYFKATQAIPAM